MVDVRRHVRAASAAWLAFHSFVFSQSIPKGIADQLTPSQQKQLEQVEKQLSPAEGKALEKEVSAVSDKQKQEAGNQLKQLSPQQLADLINRARGQMDGRDVKADHFVEGPGLPMVFILSPAHLTGDVPPPAMPENARKLFEIGKQLMPNIVLFINIKASNSSEAGVGSGILISRTLVLTARHVADQIAAKPDDFGILRTDKDQTKKDSIYTPLVFRSKIEVALGHAGDPDVALIQVAGSIDPKSITLAAGLLKPKEDIASLGGNADEPLPKLSIGIVTTSYDTRNLADKLPMKRKVFGSSLRSYAGLSGSPVFDVKGSVVGIIVAGPKNFSGIGEAVIPISQGQSWETFPSWTWVTPLDSTLQRIRMAVTQDK